MIRAVAIDFDGTLLPPPSVAVRLARLLGATDALERVEADFVAGRIDGRAAQAACVAAYAGHAAAPLLDRAARLRPIKGAAAAIRAMKGAGLTVFLATMTWSFAAEPMARHLGMDASGGAVAEIRRGRFTGRLRRSSTETEKRDWVLAQLKARGISPKDCAAIGDSRSDLPLFAAVGLSIAFNAIPATRKAADAIVDAEDFRAVLPLL